MFKLLVFRQKCDTYEIIFFSPLPCVSLQYANKMRNIWQKQKLISIIILYECENV